MRKKRKKWVVVAIILVFFPLSRATASEVHQVETSGTIGFTGVYQPIGTPEPPPITEITKPDGSLPQTNDVRQLRIFWLGILMVSFVFLLWKRKKQKQNLNSKKVGIFT